jgi:hypothetical protein
VHRQKPLAGVHRGSRGTCSDLQALLPKPAGVNPKPRFTVPLKIILIIVRQLAGAGIQPVRFHLPFLSRIKMDGLGCQLSDMIDPDKVLSQLSKLS